MDPEDREHFFDFFRNDVRDVLRHFVHKIPAMSDPIFNVSVEIAEEPTLHNSIFYEDSAEAPWRGVELEHDFGASPEIVIELVGAF